MKLTEYLEVFLSSRDVSLMYSAMVRAHVRHFVRWCGGDVSVQEITCDKVNGWLSALRQTRLTAHTQDTYRRNLLAVWRAAYREGATNEAPLRVRRIKKPPRIVEAYTLEDINRLLHAAAQLRGKHVNGNRRSDFWLAFLHSAYSTGQRRSDLLMVFKKQIAADGTATLAQRKTGKIVRVRFSGNALKFIDRLADVNGLALPWPYRVDSLVPRFTKLRELAGLPAGSLKWLRRSAGSYCELLRPGDGPRLLGNTPQAFRLSYDAPAITQSQPVQPPPL